MCLCIYLLIGGGIFNEIVKTGALSKVAGINYAEELLFKCNSYGKNVYSFDEVDKKVLSTCNNIKIFYPSIIKENVPQHLLRKLYCISTPILCVIGTSAKQGKFTVQCALRNQFIKMGYHIGQLGTEPSSLLFGFDQVFPIGYAGTVEISGNDIVCTLNSMLHMIEMKNPDLIITGTQSQTVPASIANLDNIPYEQSYVLYGINPDGFVLICNYFDDDDYVIRTIRHAESYCNARVIALVIYPVDYDFKWTEFGGRSKHVSQDNLLMKQKNLSEITGKKVFILGNALEMERLANECIRYYTQE